MRTANRGAHDPLDPPPTAARPATPGSGRAALAHHLRTWIGPREVLGQQPLQRSGVLNRALPKPQMLADLRAVILDRPPRPLEHGDQNTKFRFHTQIPGTKKGLATLCQGSIFVCRPQLMRCIRGRPLARHAATPTRLRRITHEWSGRPGMILRRARGSSGRCLVCGW